MSRPSKYQQDIESALDAALLREEQLKERLKDAQFLVKANKLRNYHLTEALEAAETFLRVHNGTVKILKQIEVLKG